jgi:predicted ester cyclase
MGDSTDACPPGPGYAADAADAARHRKQDPNRRERMTPEDRKEFVRRAYEEVFNAGNLAAADSYFAADFVNLAMPTDWPRGPEGVRRAVSILRSAFPDLCYTIEEVLVEGEVIAARWTARGTHTGELRGPMGQVAPTGRSVSFGGITMGRVARGKASGESWAMADFLGLLGQIGAGTPAAVAQPL